MYHCNKCKSNNWDYACVGVPNAILCIECGHVYGAPRPNDEMPKYPVWPFPTKDKPLTPWTPGQEKTYNRGIVEGLGDALL